MNLVIFTAHYPFGSGEEFLENEIKIAELYFEQIIFVTSEKKASRITKYVPQNAKIIRTRRHENNILRVIKCIQFLFKARVWKELKYARKTTDYSFVTILKGILLQESVWKSTWSAREKWMIKNEKNIFYTYWFGCEFAFLPKEVEGIRISRAHGGDCFFTRAYHPYRREALNNSDHVFPISSAGKKDIVEHYREYVGDLEKRIEVSRLGIAIPNVLNPIETNDTKVIVSCSNIIKLKRLDILIEALSEINDIDIKWIHFGDGELKSSIEEYATEKLSSKQNISYEFRGYVTNETILDYYVTNHVDLFVNCSDVEGIPVSMMEAMSFGIPAIGRDVGGISELVDNESGFLLSSQASAQKYMFTICDFLKTDESEIINKRKLARTKVKTMYDAEVNYQEFYRKIIAYEALLNECNNKK